MAGLAGLFGGDGGMFGGGSLYGDMLTPEQKQALAFRGLMSAAGALGQAAMPSRMPVPLGAALGQAAGAMASGQDEGAMAALKAALVGLQGKEIASKVAARDAFMKGNDKLQDAVNAIFGGGGVAAPAVTQSGASLGEGLAPGGAQAPKSGGVTLAEAKAAAIRAGFDEEGANTIAAISVPESSLNPNAYNPKDPKGGSFGLTQINGVHPGAREALGNPDRAMELAFQVSKGGKDFSPWAAYTSGAYKPYLAEAAKAAPAAADVVVAPGGATNVVDTPIRLAASTATPSPAPAAGAGARGGLPPWMQFNSRGEPYNLADAPGQQITAAQVTPERMRQLAQANVNSTGAVTSGPPVPANGGTGPGAPPPAQAAPVFGNLSPGGGVDPAKMQALLLALARQNAGAEMSGLGNPYNSMISVLQGSPQMAGAKAFAERSAVQPLVGPEAYAKQFGTNQADLALKPQIEGETELAKNLALQLRAKAQADIDRQSKRLEQLGAASLDPTTIIETLPNGQRVERQITRQQYADMVSGQAGQPTSAAPDAIQPAAPTQQGGLQPGGVVYGKPYLGAGETRSQEALATSGVKAIDEAHAGELAANRRTQSLGQMAEALKGFVPGATREVQLRGYRILKDLGITQSDDVPPAELFQQAARHLQIVAAPKGQGSVSNYERELFGQAVPNMTNSPEALAKAIDIAKRLDDYDRSVAQIHRDVAKENRGVPNYLEAQQRIAALGPPLSPGEMGALEALRQGKEAATPGGAAAPTAGGPTATGPNGQKLILRDGQWVPLQ